MFYVKSTDLKISDNILLHNGTYTYAYFLSGILKSVIVESRHDLITEVSEVINSRHFEVDFDGDKRENKIKKTFFMNNLNFILLFCYY